jgi:hypothetical protein
MDGSVSGAGVQATRARLCIQILQRSRDDSSTAVLIIRLQGDDGNDGDPRSRIAQRSGQRNVETPSLSCLARFKLTWQSARFGSNQEAGHVIADRAVRNVSLIAPDLIVMGT